jgi:hypothetical protein
MIKWFWSKKNDDEQLRIANERFNRILAPYYDMPNTPEAVALVLAYRYRDLRWVGEKAVGEIEPAELALAKYMIDKCPAPKT